MRLYQLTNQPPPTETEADEIDAMGADLLRSLRTIAGRLEQFVTLLDQEHSADPQPRPNARW